MFAPGHIGELTQFLPVELVDAVVEETGARQRRLRDLPSRVGVYFLLNLALFPEIGYLRVWDKMCAALRSHPVARPSEKALRDLRRRLTAAPIRALFEVVAGPLAQPRTPGVSYRRWRTVAFDGCGSLRVPDAERNRAWLGRIRYRLAWAGYPTLMLMTLVETGTRGLLGAAFGPHDSGEQAYARRLLHLLGPDMLVLGDRGFDGNDFLASIAGRGAQFLVRLRAARRLPVLARLDDGSFLTRIGDLTVRIIDADITVTCADGSVVRGRYRLVTTLTDPRRDSAATLLRLFHERWEIESAYYALRHTMLRGRVLRSTDPPGLEQEMWALLTVYQLLRAAMVEAIESEPGLDPDRACFTTALQAARDHVILAAGQSWAGSGDRLTAIGRQVMSTLLRPRRHRLSARKVKSPTSRYHTRPAGDDRPLTSQRVISIHLDVHEGQAEGPAITPEPQARVPARPLTGIDQVLAFLRNEPGRAWTGPELARHLAVPNVRSFCVQLCRWAHQGFLCRPRRGVYGLATEHPPERQLDDQALLTSLDRLLLVLHADPRRAWTGRELATRLGVTNIKSYQGQLRRWTHVGWIHKTGPDTYTLNPDAAPNRNLALTIETTS